MTKTQKTSKKSSIALLLLLVAFVIIIGAALAFFSDSGLVSFSGTAGTVKIEVNGGSAALVGTQFYTIEGVAKSQALDADNLNPGDYIYIPFEVENLGTKSVKVRAGIGAIEILDAEDNPLPVTGIFTLYVVPAVAFTEIGTVTGIDTIEDWIAAEILSGSPRFVSAAGLDTSLSGSEEPDVLDASNDPITTATLHYVLYFSKTAGNEYQEASVTFDIDVQAIQYRNTASADWTSFFTITP